MHALHGGRRPTAILKDNGQLTRGTKEAFECWHQHFRKVLNVESIYEVEAVEDMQTLEPIPMLLHMKS